MKFKRVLSTALAGALALSLAVPAFAEETVISGTYEEQEIAVTVPDAGDAIINPYGLDIELVAAKPEKPESSDGAGDGEEAVPAVSISGQQIVTKPLTVSNQSGMDLNVSANVVITIPETSGLKLSATSTKGANPALTTKSAYMLFQMTTASTITQDSTEDDIATVAAAWTAPTAKGEKDIVVVAGTKGASSANMVKLTKATDGKAVDGGVALFRLTGDCVASPTIPWNESDTFEVTVAFTFMPA